MAQGAIEKATAAELRRMGATSSPAGQVALRLAKRLDADADAGSAVAAMTKELRSVLDALSAKEKPKADPVDDLAKKREERQAKARRSG